MTDLPEDFSPWEHLHGMLLTSFNQAVERSFINVPPDITTALGGMRVACILQDDDSVEMTVLRLLLFYFVFKGELPTPVYAAPIPDVQSEVKFRPQVHLLFKEDWNATLLQEKLSPATAQISWRLMHETSQTINESKAKVLALRIKELLGLEGGFTWEKGTKKVVYRDSTNGIDFRLLAQSEGEGQRVIEKILTVIEAPFHEELLGVASNHKNYPVVPAMQEVYGKERRKPRERPITRVRFQRAELTIHGLQNPVILLDRTGKHESLVHF